MKKTYVLGILFFILFNWGIFSHGILGKIDKVFPCIIVTAHYEDGTELSFEKVQIHYLEDESEFQNGKTDQNGRFAFIPDKVGEWQILIDDQMGHSTTLRVKISQEFFNKQKSQTTKDTKEISPLLKMVFGVVLILLLTIGFYIWGKRRDKKDAA